jgi:ABC-type enterobactin transport system permease subunit
VSVSAGIRPDSVRFGAKQVVLRLGWFSFRAPLRGVLVGGALVLIAVAIALVSLATGAYPLSLDQVVGARSSSNGGYRGCWSPVCSGWRSG